MFATLRKGLNGTYSALSYRFTVFTATFNNSNKLVRTYESIENQTFRDFEWIVVDDGSTDDTRAVVEEIIARATFPITYIYKQNGHKAIAENRGVKEAKGELFVNIDHDDEMKPRALERFDAFWKELEEAGEMESYCSVAALCEDHNGRIVGTKFPMDRMVSDAWSIRVLHRVKGDKFGCQRTSVMREFPFPEDAEGHYLPESIVWFPMGKKYKTLYINEVLRVFYQDAESVSTTNRPWKNAVGSQRNHHMILNHHLEHLAKNPKMYLRSAAAFSRFSYHLGKKASWQFASVKPLRAKLLLLVGIPTGYAFYRRDHAQDRKGAELVGGTLRRDSLVI